MTTGIVKRRYVVLALWCGLVLAGAPAAAEPASMSAPPRELSGMEDRERVTLPPMTVRLDPPDRDRRPFYVGLGLVVMATAFWWNRRQRDRFEHEDDRARRPRRTRPRRDAHEVDEDADDLHAAARGETPDPPDRQAP
ncbi:MAG: hypothetical protein ABIY55_21405 [Kofleriaceae bacterium]